MQSQLSRKKAGTFFRFATRFRAIEEMSVSEAHFVMRRFSGANTTTHLFSYVGNAEKFDRVQIQGSLDNRDAAIFFWNGDKILAVATLGRDHIGLVAGAAIEAGDHAALIALAKS